MIVPSPTPSGAPGRHSRTARNAHIRALQTHTLAVVTVLVISTPPPAAGHQQWWTDAPIAETRTIGVTIGEPEYEFSSISAIRFLPDNRIVVADAGLHNIRVFTTDGVHVRTMGRSGGGPGEYVTPTSIFVDTLIRVLDPRQGRVTIYSVETLELRTTRPLQSLGGYLATRVGILSDGSLIASTIPPVSYHGREEPLPLALVLRLRPGGSVDTLMRYQMGGALWYTVGRSAPYGGARTPFGPGGAWAIDGPVLALADGIAAEVRYLRLQPDGTLRQEARVTLPGEGSRPVVAEDMQEVEDSLRALLARARRSPGRIGLIGPTHWSTAWAARFGTDGTLWIFRATRTARGQVWTQLSRDRILGSWRFPPGFSLHDVRYPWAAGVKTDEEGVQVVQLLRLADDRP